MSKLKWKCSKQYCAEQERDPYELLYRKADMFSDYMDDGPCYIPKVQEHLADPVELVETIDEIDLPAHRLTGKVRYQYLSYLENLLERNYETWSNTVESFDNVTFTPSEIQRCAECIEMKAVKSCMIVSLYRSYILKAITQIRKETNEFSLHPNLINMKFTPKSIKKELCDVAVQTDSTFSNLRQSESSVGELPLLDVPTMSLDDKIRDFEKQLHINEPDNLSCKKRRKEQRTKITKDERKLSVVNRMARRKSKLSAPNEGNSHQLCEDVQPVDSSNTCSVVPMARSTKHADEDDQIMRELEAMFETEDNGNIFESCENQVQIKAIINEIEQFDPPNLDEKCEKVIVSNDTMNGHPSPMLNYSKSDIFKNSEHGMLDNPTEKIDDLKKSLWPCELHMQKMRLRDLLSNIAENNYMRYERIQARFIVLFGEFEPEDDELGPYSPSIELDDVLVSSCRQRIAKWVVQALMKPLNDGLIGNRFLFKKLAKHIADSIIYQNQYPDQQFIKNYVLDYFCAHRAILCIEDMI
ncbi:uncharacterized protein LOC128743466 [Sabethes cyaneus]|uniref:uncharacterized protein LOC128743466 n=1 Tax=Sabethes cyaneus TaxID=53552 RepID=UPI00237DBA63|nr:uncharacterized protein LOC128743466 [Sabethes cyaneus]